MYQPIISLVYHAVNKKTYKGLNKREHEKPKEKCKRFTIWINYGCYIVTSSFIEDNRTRKSEYHLDLLHLVAPQITSRLYILA